MALARTGRIQHVAWAVGAWIGAAYWLTNIAPASAPAFIAAQLAGGAIGTILAVIIYPARPSPVRAGEPAQFAS